MTSTGCARYALSDGTLCSTHHGRFASPSENRCDRASQPRPPQPEPLTPDLRAALGRAMRRANAAAIPDTEEWQARMRAQADDLIVAARAEGIGMSLSTDAARAALGGATTPPEGTRLVLMTEDLALALGASRVEWGEPDANGWYNPTLYSGGATTPDLDAIVARDRGPNAEHRSHVVEDDRPYWWCGNCAVLDRRDLLAARLAPEATEREP